MNTRDTVKHSLLLAVAATTLTAFGQGSHDDYERALSLGKRTENKVFRDRVKAHWLPGGTSFWYRVQTRPKQQECVLVDAVTGTRTPGFVAPPEKPLPTQTDAPRRSARTGEETSLTFVNRTTGEVELFWLDFNGQRLGYGRGDGS